MKKHIIAAAIVIVGIVWSASLVAQPGIGISKRAPLIGTGSNGNPLQIDGCGSGAGSALIWGGSAWGCGSAGQTYTAGTSLTESPTGTFNVSLPGGTPCPSGSAVDNILSDGTKVCGASVPSYTAGDALTLTGSDFDVAVRTGGGLAISSDALSLLQTCSTNQVLAWDGDSWECAADATGSLADGDKGDVTVSSSGANWQIDANTITGTELNITTTTCTGQFVSAINSDGVGTCTSEVGDISAITVTAPIYGATTSGSAALGLTACDEGLIYKMSGGAWTCSEDGDDACNGIGGACSANVDCCTGYCALGGVCALGPTDGDKGDVTVSSTGAAWAIDSGVVGPTELENDLDLSGNGTTTVGDVRCKSQEVSTTGTINDLTVNSDTCHLIFTGGSSITLTGMTGGALDRCVLVTASTTSGAGVAITHEGAGSTAANRSVTAGSGTWTLISNATTMACYESADSRWHWGFNTRFPSIVVSGSASAASLAVTGTSTLTGNIAAGDNWADDFDLTSETMYQGDAPALSGCNANCTIESYSTNHRGRISCTDDPGSDCTVTFANSGWETNAPACVLTFEAAAAPDPAPYVKTISATAFSFDLDTVCSSVSGLSACAYSYHCDGMI